MLSILQDLGPDAVEKYGILGLLYVLLAAIGAFLTKVGFDMNKSIQANTSAVQQLVAELKLLVVQQAGQAERIQQEIETQTERALDAFREGLRGVREEVQRVHGNHAG